MKKSRTLILAGIAAGLLPGMSIAQDSRNQGYLVDSYGNNITTSLTTGLCVRDSDWTPARSVEPCDPVARKAEAPVPGRLAAVTPAAATPPPAAKPATAAIPPQKVEFSADALFEFDKSVLKPEGRAMLDSLARDLAGASYGTIVAIGHTDRIGSNEYNQKLSERRAHAVKDYLVSKDIAADRVNAEGRGETQPATRVNDCTGPVNSKLKACLQPDRRVHVEVSGTRTPTVGLR